ncbi:MAG: hypothetical protein V1735_05545 [Nanoarchaeota archaeon]
MGLNRPVMDVIRASLSRPGEVVEVLPGVTVKYHPPLLCIGLYHLRFSHDGKVLDAFIQPGGDLQGAAYQGTTDMIDNQNAYAIINSKLESILETERASTLRPREG